MPLANLDRPQLHQGVSRRSENELAAADSASNISFGLTGRIFFLIASGGLVTPSPKESPCDSLAMHSEIWGLNYLAINENLSGV